MVSYITSRSLLLLDHLGWTVEDLRVFDTPFEQWPHNDKYKYLLEVIQGMEVVNDIAERSVQYSWIS
jgi:hypothetical protein